MGKHFFKECIYPNEAFVQKSIEEFFSGEGYDLIDDPKVDLIAEKDGEIWVVEAKGMTTSVGLDFNTCLGQLIKSMDSSEKHYALALPKEDKYKYQCSLIPQYIRSLMQLNIIVTDETGGVKIIRPEDDIEDAFR